MQNSKRSVWVVE